MKKIGAFAGKFLPPHLGHIAVIDRMLKECEEAVVVISDDPKISKGLCEKVGFPYFDAKQRAGWIEKHYNHNPRLHLVVFDESSMKTAKNPMEAYAKLFWKHVAYPVNVKYADESYRELNETYFKSCEFRAIDRDKIPVHGTDIRADFKKFKSYLIPEAMQDILKAKKEEKIHGKRNG